MRAPRMLASFERVFTLPNVDFANPPMPGLNVNEVCQRPLEVSVKKSDLTNQLSLGRASFNNSPLSLFLNNQFGHNELTIGATLNVVGREAGVPAATLNVQSIDTFFVTLACLDHSWLNLCNGNIIQVGDKIGIWGFTRNDQPGVWLAVAVTRKRRYRSTVLI